MSGDSDFKLYYFDVEGPDELIRSILRRHSLWFQSMTIARYVARQLGLTGSNDIEAVVDTPWHLFVPALLSVFLYL